MFSFQVFDDKESCQLSRNYALINKNYIQTFKTNSNTITFVCMKDFIGSISFNINNKVFIKDPLTSDLGKNILNGSISLINELGYESFTFKKLGAKIGSTEASIYRYFENKAMILAYLTLWYWTWQEYRLVFSLMNLTDSSEKLKKAISILTEKIEEDNAFPYINEKLLNNIIIEESAKVYLNKKVNSRNEDGIFKKYKDVVERVADLILEINPKYEFPHMLVSTMIEGAHHQRYFAEHLPKLTDTLNEKDAVVSFYESMTFKAIK